jgi:hypothetical protein
MSEFGIEMGSYGTILGDNRNGGPIYDRNTTPRDFYDSTD